MLAAASPARSRNKAASRPGRPHKALHGGLLAPPAVHLGLEPRAVQRHAADLPSALRPQRRRRDLRPQPPVRAIRPAEPPTAARTTSEASARSSPAWEAPA